MTKGKIELVDGVVKLDGINSFAIPAKVLGAQDDYTIEFDLRRSPNFKTLPRMEGALRLVCNRDATAHAGLSLIYFPPAWDLNGGIGNLMGTEVNGYWNGECGGLDGTAFNKVSIVVKDRLASIYRNGLLLAMTGEIKPSQMPLTIGGKGWRHVPPDKFDVNPVPEPYELRSLKIYNQALAPTGYDRSTEIMRSVSGDGYCMQRADAKDPSLPRILIVGDSISMGYRGFITEHFKGRACVDYWVGGGWFASDVKGDDFPALRSWDGVLSNGPYDVVSWNSMTLHMWNGAPGRCSEATYPAQMTKVVEHLQKTAPDTKFIWIRCTPWRTMPDTGRPTLFKEKNDAIIRLNKLTDEIMAKHDIPEVDLYSLCEMKFDAIPVGSKDALHWPKEVCGLMADEIIKVIERVLPEKHGEGKPAVGKHPCFMKLSSLFCDHAVVQRGIPVPVWGWTKPLVRVKARLGEHTAEAMAGADGRFLVRLPAMPAGGPYDLEVTAEGGSGAVVAKDVWVGEVWLASGQSNMELPLARITGKAGESELRNAGIPGLRMINIPHVAYLGRQSDVDAGWQVATPESAREFSAVGYHFAKRLHEELGVAVGIVNSSWGGTPVEAWTSREALVRNPDVAAYVAHYEAMVNAPATPTVGDKLSDEKYPADPGNTGEAKGWAGRDGDDGAWAEMQLPQTWQAAGHAHCGVFWFRKTVEVPAAWVGRDLVLQIGAVDKQDTTYFNGVKVGATGKDLEEQYWAQVREYRVPARLVQAGRNVIAVRVYSFVSDGGMIGPANQMRLGLADRGAGSVPLEGVWRYRMEHDLGMVSPPAGPLGAGNQISPYILYDSMIAPLIPYGLRGAIWYQGECNTAKPWQYHRLLTDMIRCWRWDWGQGDFPFLIVQLANFRPAANHQDASQWARLREAQFQTLSEPATGLAVTIDIGEALDIHPQNKVDVGRRLAQWALSATYGRPVVASGPLYVGMTREGSTIRLRFDHADGGLVARGGALRTFVMAGSDRTFHDATAVIDDRTVVVSCPAVPAPMAVRYAWADNPEGCNLYNAEGLPASPFRTDTWP